MEKIKKIFSTTTGKVIGIIVVLIFLGGVASSGDKKSPSSDSSKSATVAVATVDPAKLAADKARLVELKTKFTYKYDEFEKKGWYVAKSQSVDNTWDKEVLAVNVNNIGYAYLSDQYYGDDWIFHTRVEVKIGDTVYKSEDIPSFDSNNNRHNSGGSVWESISYTSDKDNGIVKAIAESGDAVVKVRFTGDEGVYDFTLSKRDQQAIKDAYELSNLIKSTGDTGAPQS